MALPSENVLQQITVSIYQHDIVFIIIVPVFPKFKDNLRNVVISDEFVDEVLRNIAPSDVPVKLHYGNDMQGNIFLLNDFIIY